MTKKLFTAALLAGTMLLTGCGNDEPTQREIEIEKAYKDANHDVKVFPYHKSRIGRAYLFEFRTTQEPIMQCAYYSPYAFFTDSGRMHCVKVKDGSVNYD